MTPTRRSETDVVVIGGGSTGCGIARDLSMRGVSVTLLEKGNLTHGTTGRMHGLLHSGARYAITDEGSARECIAENEILRDIASHCVEPTGGLFVQRPGDPDDYFERKLRACRACDIPARVLSGREAREREPYLAADVERAIAVPDGAVDPFRLCVANAADARDHGARIETHARVTDLVVEDGHVVGVDVEFEAETDRRGDSGSTAGSGSKEGSGSAAGSGTAVDREIVESSERITASHVVNATGAWAGRIGAMADVDVAVRPSKGAMVVTNVRHVDTVINRCVPKGDADVIQPHETTAILGTTDVEVDDPEDYPEEQWEVDLLIDELSKLVPVIREARILRSYWGVRPLYEPPDRETADPTDITRQYFLLDHETCDDVPGLTSIVGGKFTTYRLMAETIADHVCSILGVSAACRTHEEPLPGSDDESVLDDHMDDFGLRSPIARRSRQRLGSRASAVLSGIAGSGGSSGSSTSAGLSVSSESSTSESFTTESESSPAMESTPSASSPNGQSADSTGAEINRAGIGTATPNPVLCDCEAVTRAEVQDAITQSGSDLNAVRIRTRASMGNCQGGFCAHRLAAELHPASDAATARDSLATLVQERWKGGRHALWGEQLAQVQLNRLLWATTMHLEIDPSDVAVDRTDDSNDSAAVAYDVSFADFDSGVDDTDRSSDSTDRRSPPGGTDGDR